MTRTFALKYGDLDGLIIQAEPDDQMVVYRTPTWIYVASSSEVNEHGHLVAVAMHE